MNILSVNADHKTVKGLKKGYLTGIVYLAPASLSGTNLCPFASKGCKKACLYTAGRGCFNNVKIARMNRTRLYLQDKVAFFNQLISEIQKMERKANKAGLIPVIRLNGTSDIAWESIPVNGQDNIMALFPHIQFYDYTKNYFRFNKDLPSNYDLTFSRSESNDDVIRNFMMLSRVAIVFNSDRLPATFLGRTVVNGDETDLRFLEPTNSIVGLIAKGKARKDTSGFVVHAK